MKGTMSVSVEIGLIAKFDELLQKYDTKRSAQVERWISAWVERETMLPDLETCRKHNVRYAKILGMCPECAVEKVVEDKAKAEADAVLSAKVQEDDLEMKFQAWTRDRSESGGYDEYMDHVGSQGYDEWKASVKEKLKASQK